MSKENTDEEILNANDNMSLTTKVTEMESTEESSLLNSIVEAVMRGDMNQVVTLALSHRSSDQKVKNLVDQALSSAISNKARLNDNNESELFTDDSDIYSNKIVKSLEDISIESSIAKSPNSQQHCAESVVTSHNVIYSQRTQSKSKETNDAHCTYYYPNDPIISSNCTSIDSNSNAALYCQSGYTAHTTDLDNHPDDSINSSLSRYQITNSSLQNVESINNLSMSQQSVQVQLPGIGNFLLQIPSNFKPGEPITLPLNLPLTPVSQTSGVNPISIHMNTGQLMSNQLLSLYNPSSNMNITAGKKMRAIAPKPSKPTYRQPLIAPKTNSPNASNQDCLNINSAPLPAPSGPGRRKNNKGRKSGRKRSVQTKSHKNSSYASSTHSMDSQDASQFNDTCNSLKQNCNNSMSTRSTYQCNYYVNNDSTDYLNQSHVTISQSFNEINSNTLIDTSDSGEKDLLSLAWEISNAELGNNDDFTTAYNLYDANNLGADSFVSSEILDQFLQNIQKDDIAELTRCSSTQINMDSRVSYASSFTTLPPCSTVLPSVTTSTYLNNYSNNSTNIELPQCIEIAEVVNLNTEDMLSELEKEENALLDKFVAQYGNSHQNDLIRCDSQTVIPVSLSSSSDCTELIKNSDINHKEIDSNVRINISNDDSDKELDLNIKECNELSEIAKQIEISCSSSHRDGDSTMESKMYTLCDNSDNQNKLECLTKVVDNNIIETNFQNNVNNSISFCTIPNTSLELIYSSNAETALLDEKTRCLMSLNFDSKRSNEPSFYITDSSLKSKTLDDFGLFEFCTDGEISLNMKALTQETEDVICDDDNKYIEPPILEDISDATPIQSDNESEDEDIDDLAFKFSRFNYRNIERPNKESEQNIPTQKLYYINLMKDLPNLDNFRTDIISTKNCNDWYIGSKEIVMEDMFSTNANSNDTGVLNCKEINKEDIRLVETEYECQVLKMTIENDVCPEVPVEDFVIENTEAKSDYQEQFNNQNVCSVKTIIEEDIRIVDSARGNSNADFIICNVNSNQNCHKKLELDEEINNEKIAETKNFKNCDMGLLEIEENVNGKNIRKDDEKTTFKNKEINKIRRRRKKVTEKDISEINLNKETLNEAKSNKYMVKKHDLNLISSMNNIQDRQRRLRKPPKKLAIYQSINFIEKEFPTDVISKSKTKTRFGITETQKANVEFKRCTRSKGTISKSFDSFYEAISRHHKISSNSKTKILKKKVASNRIQVDNALKISTEGKLNDNDIDVNVIDNDCFISCTDDDLRNSQTQTVISDFIKSDKITNCLSSQNMISVSNDCLNSLTSDYKNCNIIRKYNLRRNVMSIENEKDELKSIKSSKVRKNKYQADISSLKLDDSDLPHKRKLPQSKKRKNSNVNDKDLLKLEEILRYANIHCYLSEYDKIDCHIPSFELRATILETLKLNLIEPTSNINSASMSNIVENKQIVDNSIYEINKKKLYPVRKINRKLRMFSGLEMAASNGNIKHASLYDMNTIEMPNRFQCCTQFAKISSLHNSLNYVSKCSSYIPESFYSMVAIQNFNNIDDLSVSDTDDVESLDAPLVIVEIDEISNQTLPIRSNNRLIEIEEDINLFSMQTNINKDNQFTESDESSSKFSHVQNNNDVRKLIENEEVVNTSLRQNSDYNDKTLENDEPSNEKNNDGTEKIIEIDKDTNESPCLKNIIYDVNPIEKEEIPSINLKSNNINKKLKVKNRYRGSQRKTNIIERKLPVIKEISSHSLCVKSSKTNKSRKNEIAKLNSQLNINSNEFDISKKYSLRPKCRPNNVLKSIVLDNKSAETQNIKRPVFNRACKKSENYEKKYAEYDKNDIINNINLRTPICAIEKLSHNDIIANLSISPAYNNLSSLEEPNKSLEKILNISMDKKEITVDNSSVNKRNVLKVIKEKISKQSKSKRSNNSYKIIRKSILRRNLNRKFNYKLRSKQNVRCFQSDTDDSSYVDSNVKLIEDGIAQIIIQSKDYNKEIVDDDDESINVESDSPNNQFNTYLDSNNVETFSRNYGSFSLKIKVQKKDPLILEENDEVCKKQKRNSKKRKKLRHFLSSIIGSDEVTLNKLNSSDESNVIPNKLSTDNTDKKRKNRKRKYSRSPDDVYSEVYNTNHELNENINYDKPPELTPESGLNEDFLNQKPIKIKLFKSTSEDVNKSEGGSFHSEKIVFSLQKSEFEEKKGYHNSINQKILQIVQDLPSKPCRQAANLAKKKIFSTAKEDRRSQNATLTSIWNSKKSNNGANKTASDILTIYQNDRCKRPRGRPPKLGQSLFISDKQASSTGTLKLKIKLSKDFKNCNNDSQSSNGENSGRTSTNDSSILNSAVAGINGPSDALSLESSNFINGITEQLDQNIEYLEAKEAKVYFDPNQVDIERIKNSYYSSKKINPESFNVESHHRLYENTIADICNKKSDIIPNSRNFSQYGDIDSVETNNLYNNILSKESSNNKLSHVPKENMNLSDNCYTNLIPNREPQDLSQTNQSFQFESQLSSPGKNSSEVWQNSKPNSSDSLTSCRNNNNSSWFSEHRNMRDPSFPNSNSILYNSYMTSPIKDSKNCISQNQNPPFVVCENENSDSKLMQRSPSKRSASSEGRKSGSNSFSLNESHNQLSPHYIRGGIGSVPSQLNIHPWSDEPNHNTSLNHTAAAWMTYAQQQAAAAAYMDPQMKAYYNLALSQSMLNNPYCGSYGNPAANSENFYSSLHSQYLNNSKDSNEKINITNGAVRNHNDTMGSFMEAAQMSSWEHFYSAAAMAGYHNSSQGAMDDYAGRAGNMLQAHHMLANGYPGSMLGRDHFTLDTNKPPLAHQNQSGTTSPIKLTASGSTPTSSSQAYSHVQMPYSHFSGTTVGFF